MKAPRAGMDESIGAKMYWKLVDDDNGKIIYRSVIRSAIEVGPANLQVNLIKPFQDNVILDTKEDVMLDEFI